MKVIIPSRLKVGAHIYTVEFRNDYRVTEGTAGAMCKETLKLTLDNANYVPRSVLEENFIHEFFGHMVFTEAGFHWNEHKEFTTTEENLIERLAPIWYQILVDNKIQEEVK